MTEAVRNAFCGTKTDRIAPVDLSGAVTVVAVDLTPMLPGGENGGAKVLVIELLRELAKIAPQWRFVLLIRAEAHDELALLDSANTERRVILSGSETRGDIRIRLLATRLLCRLPARLRRLMARVRYALRRRMSRLVRRSLVSALGADLLFCPFTAPVLAEPGVPVVCALHDLQYKSYPQFFTPEDAAHRDAVFRATCRDATLIAAVSDYTRNSALQHGRLDPQRIRTVYSRLAGRLHTDPVSNVAAERRGLVAGRYLLYPANFWRHKNHEMLLTAFCIAAGSGLPRDIRLVCTGAPGERMDYLQRAAQAFGVVDRILFPGYLDANEFAGLLSASSGVIFPSLYEGFGLPVLEAMVAGVPVACGNLAALPEIAADAAWLFDPRKVGDVAAAMVVLVTDNEVRDRLIAAGRKRALEFADTRRMADEYLALFRDALTRTRARSSLAGVFEDGWVGDELRLDVVSRVGNAQLDLEVLVPEGVPYSAVWIEVKQAPDGAPLRFQIRRGESRRCSLPVQDGRVSLQLAPSFIPAQNGYGEDPRSLTLKLDHCSVRGADGSREHLWGTARS